MFELIMIDTMMNCNICKERNLFKRLQMEVLSAISFPN